MNTEERNRLYLEGKGKLAERKPRYFGVRYLPPEEAKEHDVFFSRPLGRLLCYRGKEWINLSPLQIPWLKELMKPTLKEPTKRGTKK